MSSDGQVAIYVLKVNYITYKDYVSGRSEIIRIGEIVRNLQKESANCSRKLFIKGECVLLWKR